MGVLPITSKLLFLCKNLAKIISGPQSTLQNNKKEVHDPLIAPITVVQMYGCSSARHVCYRIAHAVVGVVVLKCGQKLRKVP